MDTMHPEGDPVVHHAQACGIASVDEQPEILCRILDHTSFDAGERFVIAWQYGLLAKGDFHWNLAQAMVTGDDWKIQRLARGFPVCIGAFLRYRHQDGYWPRLEQRMRDCGLMDQIVARR